MSCKVLIDARVVDHDRSGVGVYTLEIIRELIRCDASGFQYEFLSAHPMILREFLGGEIIVHSAPSHESHPYSELWSVTKLPQLIKSRGIQLYWGPAFYLPWKKLECSSVVTIHDVSVFTHPKEYSWKFRFLLKRYIRQSVRLADRITAPSKTVRQQIVDMFSVHDGCVSVVSGGLAEGYASGIASPGLPELPKQYVMAVGAGAPRKNLDLLKGIFKDCKESLSPDLNLLLIGDVDKVTVNENIVEIPRLEHHHLASLYKNAKALLVPSLDEGFGIPVIEAFSCDCPVILSDIPVFHEVARDAGFYFHLSEGNKVVDLLNEILQNGISEKRRVAMHAIAAEYTWQSSTKSLLNVFRELTIDHGRC